MDRKIILASLLLAASPFVAGCMPEDPRTHLDWGVNTAPAHHAAAKDTAKTYVYDENASHPSAAPKSDDAPRSAPSRAPVTSQPLAPINQGARADAPAFAWPVSGH